MAAGTKRSSRPQTGRERRRWRCWERRVGVREWIYHVIVRMGHKWGFHRLFHLDCAIFQARFENTLAVNTPPLMLKSIRPLPDFPLSAERFALPLQIKAADSHPPTAHVHIHTGFVRRGHWLDKGRTESVLIEVIKWKNGRNFVRVEIQVRAFLLFCIGA